MFNFDEEKNGIPSFEQMMKPVMVVLQQYGGSAKNTESQEEKWLNPERKVVKEVVI